MQGIILQKAVISFTLNKQNKYAGSDVCDFEPNYKPSCYVLIFMYKYTKSAMQVNKAAEEEYTRLNNYFWHNLSANLQKENLHCRF